MSSSCFIRTALRRHWRFSCSGVPEDQVPGSWIECVTRAPRGNGNPVGDCDVAEDACAAANLAIAADARTAGNRRTAGHGGMRADRARCARCGSCCPGARRARAPCHPVRRGRYRCWRQSRNRRPTSSRPSWGTLSQWSSSHARPKPSEPSTAPECTTTRAPRCVFSTSVTRAMR